MQVRWSGFSVLLVTLGGALARLHTCVNELLPLLPGSTLRPQVTALEVRRSATGSSPRGGGHPLGRP